MADADPQIAEAPSTVREPGEPGTEAAAEPRRRWGRLALMLVVPLAILIGGVVYWLGLQGKVSTDDAYVKQDKVSISAEVGGKILQVYVKNGDHVKAGDLLYRIDPEPFQIQLDQATAAIAAAQANVTALANSADLSGADIAKAREDIAFAQRVGTTIRLAYSLSGGTPHMLGLTAIERTGGKLMLHLPKGGETLFGEAVQRRLDAVGRAFGLPTAIG